jgi:hypothetical protein
VRSCEENEHSSEQHAGPSRWYDPVEGEFIPKLAEKFSMTGEWGAKAPKFRKIPGNIPLINRFFLIKAEGGL